MKFRTPLLLPLVGALTLLLVTAYPAAGQSNSDSIATSGLAHEKTHQSGAVTGEEFLRALSNFDEQRIDVADDDLLRDHLPQVLEALETDRDRGRLNVLTSSATYQLEGPSSSMMFAYALVRDQADPFYLVVSRSDDNGLSFSTLEHVGPATSEDREEVHLRSWRLNGAEDGSSSQLALSTTFHLDTKTVEALDPATNAACAAFATAYIVDTILGGWAGVAGDLVVGQADYACDNWIPNQLMSELCSDSVEFADFMRDPIGYGLEYAIERNCSAGVLAGYASTRWYSGLYYEMQAQSGTAPYAAVDDYMIRSGSCDPSRNGCQKFDIFEQRFVDHVVEYKVTVRWPDRQRDVSYPECVCKVYANAFTVRSHNYDGPRYMTVMAEEVLGGSLAFLMPTGKADRDYMYGATR